MGEIVGRVLAIDPDPNGGSWVLFNDDQSIRDHGWRTPVEDLCHLMQGMLVDAVVVEGIQSYGMPVGASVFETAKSIGELRGFTRWLGLPMSILNPSCIVPFDDSLTRPKIKAALCNSARAKDSNVRRALLDLYGGRKVAVGLKASPGPLYGIKKDEWAALALGVTWLAMRGLGPLSLRDGIKKENRL